MDRIRDKCAASRKHGMWMGRKAPLGYDVKDRKLVSNIEETARSRKILDCFIAIGSVTIIAK